ncbi:DUF3617 family protein [Rhodanobacter sp. C03]|uniref:DUF3617 domain-containing protein n=1 Tax=Rhodanobacter sp. C03 TaxID=1945858 RepID=UPI0009864BA2|nr:DUF3617 family protein [Rhodanobacter sp. C03]OOG60223.1 hypothetical protein B0E48_05595 [Rhodanobacter sp. C03]
MNDNLIKPERRLRRSSVMRHGFSVALFVAVGFGSPLAHADSADFRAMPGLWKITTRKLSHGHPGKPSIEWHCIDEGADPWTSFASFAVPTVPSCQRNDQHRSSTALAWAVSCSGHPPVNGRGRVDFDSAEHYIASIELQKRGEVVRVEGQRYAACTGPSD